MENFRDKTQAEVPVGSLLERWRRPVGPCGVIWAFPWVCCLGSRLFVIIKGVSVKLTSVGRLRAYEPWNFCSVKEARCE